MRRTKGYALASLALLVAAAAFAPGPALSQSDPATQRLIDQLRFNNATRGMVRPQAGAVAPAPVTAPEPASAGRPATLPTAPPRVGAQRPATTAPAGVPAVSITVNFASGSAALAPGALEQLNRLGRALTSEELAPFRFRIEGHTDTIGAAEENRVLSERRAEAVRDYLVTRFGISRDRLTTEGLGESRLIVPTADEVAQAQNRRVQVLNLGN